MQRLLTRIFLEALQLEESGDPSGREARKRFFFHFDTLTSLVMWKVQLLDRRHLLLKFGSVDAVMSRQGDTAQLNAFFALYDMESTSVVGFFLNTSSELFTFYERFADHFRASSSAPLWTRYARSFSNSAVAAEQLLRQKEATSGGGAGGGLGPSAEMMSSQVIKRALADLPMTGQSFSPSPYFDPEIFCFDDKLICSVEKPKPCPEHPIKFRARDGRSNNALRFKMSPAGDGGAGGAAVRGKKVATYMFHPVYPFAISVVHSMAGGVQHNVVNFHGRP